MIYLFSLTEMEENIIFKINQIGFLIISKSIKMQKKQLENGQQIWMPRHIILKDQNKISTREIFKLKNSKNG